MNESMLAALQNMPKDNLITRMGIEFLSITADEAVGTMPVEGNVQPYGLLHGGASAVLAETLGSMAAMAHAGEGRMAVGVDLNITHHRSVRNGIVTGTATALHRGRTTATYAINVTDQDNHNLATARLTCVVKTLP
ncbi:PaaI family thioesterase [Demequina aurantiaca]|uniref:PaaI family thioesterase n=1 Tax=Demequina aurantiaca TaxID=676200 RepID=UPI000A61469A|nr:hotdog fold thioesterase [Demequina aurantiaca]